MALQNKHQIYKASAFESNRICPRKNSFVAVLLMAKLSLVASACSPYIYKAEIGEFDGAVSALSDTIDKMTVGIKAQPSEIGKLRALPSRDRDLQLSPTCALRTAEKQPCSILVDAHPVVEIQEPYVESFLKDIDKLKQLAAYARSLASVTKAEDRAALDAASESLASKLVALTGPLAPIAGPSTNLLRLTGATLMDHRRLRQLSRSVERVDPLLQQAAPSMKRALLALTNVYYVSEHRRLRALEITIHKTRPGALRRDMIDDLFESAAKLRALQQFKPEALIDRLVVSHKGLTDAIRNRRPESAQLLIALEKFSTAAGELNNALATNT